MKRSLLSVLLLLAACGTPQEQCINAVTRDMRVVDRLIKEAEGNIARGYAFEEVTVWVTRWEVGLRSAAAAPGRGRGTPAPPHVP